MKRRRGDLGGEECLLVGHGGLVVLRLGRFMAMETGPCLGAKQRCRESVFIGCVCKGRGFFILIFYLMFFSHGFVCFGEMVKTKFLVQFGHLLC